MAMRLLVSALGILILAGSTPVVAQVEITGTWLGNIDVQGQSLRFVVHIEEDDEGIFVASADSPDQGAAGIPVDAITFDGSTLAFGIRSLALRYEGRYVADDDGERIEGTFTQGGFSTELIFERVDEVAAPPRPQTPEPPFPYSSIDVTYEQTIDGFRLDGTLTVPDGAGPHPAVLLISGSGAQDRDETIAGHKPFLILADHLSRHGVAVLRVDDRGVGESGGSRVGATSEDFANDVLESVRFLTEREEIDRRRIGLIGHSEGGIIAPKAALRSDDVAFLVLMAAPGVTGEEILYRQGELLMRAAGSTDDAVARMRRQQERAFEILRAEPDTAEAMAQLRELTAVLLEELSEEERAALGMTEELLEAQFRLFNTAWFRYFLKYDPAPALEAVDVPVLAVIGSLDLQVDPAQNLPVITAALERGGNPNYAVAKLPKLNHLFQTAETGAPVEYGRIEESFAPAALKVITDWIHLQTKLMDASDGESAQP